MKPSTDTLIQQLKALADATRMRLVALCGHGECSVSELTRVVGLSQPRTSQQLKQLCDAGLLQRFRDGQRMYYRIPARGGGAARQLLELIPRDDAVIGEDAALLRQLRVESIPHGPRSEHERTTDRAVAREIIELTNTSPLGDLLDIGCGRGKLMKLLASRANQIVGLDLDADARQLARAELMLAGIPNCGLRQGDMYRMPFDDAEFDTVILDDVVATAVDPDLVFREAKRMLRTGGRLIVLQSVNKETVAATERLIANGSAAAGMRVAPARLAPQVDPAWLVSVATQNDSHTAAA